MERSGIQRYIYNIWPAIYRLINGTVYFLIITLINLVKSMFAQVKNR